MAIPAGSSRLRVAGNIRRIRLERGLSQEALGALAGIHRTFVGHVERAESNTSIDTLDRIAEALHVDTAVFFDGLDPGSPA